MNNNFICNSKPLDQKIRLDVRIAALLGGERLRLGAAQIHLGRVNGASGIVVADKNAQQAVVGGQSQRIELQVGDRLPVGSRRDLTVDAHFIADFEVIARTESIEHAGEAENRLLAVSE